MARYLLNLEYRQYIATILRYIARERAIRRGLNISRDKRFSRRNKLLSRKYRQPSWQVNYDSSVITISNKCIRLYWHYI